LYPIQQKGEKMDKFYKLRTWIRIIFITAAVMLFTSPALCEYQKIGSLYSFDGDVMMKSNGLWGEPPQKGMPVYHGDKFITGADGTIRILFHDGSLLDILPNSNVRVAELIGDEGLSSKKDTRKREIRAFLGTVLYKSSPDSIIKTKLVSSESLTVIPSDSENRFGTDGKLAFIDRSKKYGDPIGNITEGNVPEATAKQSAENPNYQTSVAAAKIRKAYIEAVKKILTGRVSPGILFASNSDSVNALILAQNSGSEEQKKTADQILELGAACSITNNKNLIVENESLINNPDPEVKARAERGLRFSQEAMRKAEHALESAEQTAEEVTAIVKKAMTGDPDQINEAFEMLKPVISDMIKKQKDINAQAMGRELTADHVTAGYVIDIKKLEEDMQNQADEEAGKTYGEDIEIGDGTISEIIRRIRNPGPPKPKKPKPLKDSEWPEYWKPDIDNKPKPYGQ